MRRLLLSAALLFRLLAVAEAAPHRLRFHPNQSLTVFAITESNGLLWLATAEGLYRYDGFHYHKISSFPFVSARFVSFTGDGSLWSGDYAGLARVVNNRFEVVLREEVMSMAASPDRVFAKLNNQAHIGLDGNDLAQIGLDGKVQFLKRRTSRDINVDSSGTLWFLCLDPDRACSIDPKRPDEIRAIPLPRGYQSVMPDSPDSSSRFWAADDQRATLLENGRPISQIERWTTHEKRRSGPLLSGRNGELWFIGETVRGLHSGVAFKDRSDHERFSPMAGFEDSRRHLWVAALGRGLVEWIPQGDWRRWFPEDFAHEAAVQVVRDRQRSILVATHKNLYRENTASGKWSPLTREERRYEGILPLEDGGFLASIRDFGMARLSPEGKVIERLKDLLPLMDLYREIVRDGKGRVWVGTKRALLRVEGQAGSLHFREERLPGVREGEIQQAVDLEVDSASRLWVGYAAGIAWLDDQDRWHRIATDQPVTAVRSFTVSGDDIWIAHRAAGFFSRLHRNGELWNLTSFTPDGGYNPADTHFLKRDSRGWIWRGSPEGVHISDGHHFEPDAWLHIAVHNGLASQETDMYGFFEDSDGSVWIAGAKGVSHLRPDPSWFDAPHDAPPPQITQVEADGRVFLFPEPVPAALPSDTKTLRIDVGSLQAPPFRDYPLRYRLLPLFQDWRISRDGTLEFRNLPKNAYTLEVGFSGAGASAVGAYPFQIGSGGSWLSWLWLFGFLAPIPIVRYIPQLERTRFRLQKAIFLLRRRYGARKFSSPSGTSSATPDYSGETFSGRYHLGRIVSRGGFSVVYEARDSADGNARVAVKILNTGSGQESWMRDRFAHEVAALRSVHHPGVVPILDSWISPAGEPCLAMPFLDGETLRAALVHGPFSFRRAARIVSELGGALADVHAHGIIHRDLKPENLILLRPGTDREQPVILDFGTAGLRSAENELAATTLMAGSFHYMAPERLTGRYSPASDVFSLGVIVLEMVSGKRLSDLNATFSDPSFLGELEKALKKLGLAARLGEAFDPEPRRRPSDVKLWAQQVATAFDQA
jgi:ligand-binding sensor domain-containing protein